MQTTFAPSWLTRLTGIALTIFTTETAESDQARQHVTRIATTSDDGLARMTPVRPRSFAPEYDGEMLKARVGPLGPYFGVLRR